ncbi:MAG: methyltransferase domain-containing protein [Planctomycetes bacterium]|nr:methyltransferase domain-containing protein [Planctomycetota bacterium]
MSHFRFFKQLFKNPRQVGALSQSSKWLSERLASGIGDCTNIVELGAGTGVVTREILKRLPKHGKLTCFEIDPLFAKYLKAIDDPRLTVITGDATRCEEYVDNIDCVVSELPLALFDKSDIDKIMDITHRAGKYVQLQYVPMLNKPIKSRFAVVKLHFVPRNLPPAFVYECHVNAASA